MAMEQRADGDAPTSGDGSRAPVRRPGTVTAAGWILSVSGVAGLLGAVAILALAGTVDSVNRQALIMWSGLVVAIAVLVIVVARGVLGGRRWAWSFAIALSVLSLVADVLLLVGVFGPSEAPGQKLFRMVVEGVVVGLLASPSTRRYVRTAP